MNKKALLAIGGGLLAGILAVILVQVYIQKQRDSIFAGMELVNVLVAADELDTNTILSKKVLSKQKMPKKYIHQNSVSLKDVSLVIGQKLNNGVKKGDPILWADLGEENAHLRFRGLADTITIGERALSIAVDQISGISGLLTAGDHIDILTTITNPQTGETTTITLLQNLTVLAIGSSMANEGNARTTAGKTRTRAYSSVTLQVTLEEAELLVFAQEKGALMGILRNPTDIQTIETIATVNYKDILKNDYRVNIQKKRNMIEVIKSGKVQE